MNGLLLEGRSLNGNMDLDKVKKAKMCSARCFFLYRYRPRRFWFYSMAKIDLLNTYKNMPCITSELGYKVSTGWGKYLVETKQILVFVTRMFWGTQFRSWLYQTVKLKEAWFIGNSGLIQNTKRRKPWKKSSGEFSATDTD